MIKKSIAALLLLSASLTTNAQKLETRITNDADVVVRGDAESLFKLVNFSDIDSSAIGKQILKGVNRKREEKATSIAQLGINVEANSYYVFKNTDSIAYHLMFVEISNRNQFEANFRESKREQIKREHGYNYIAGYSDFTVWNDHMLVLVSGNEHRGYFEDNEERLNKMNVEGESDFSFRKTLRKRWVKEKALAIFNAKHLNTISTNKKYQNSKKKDALVSVWIPNYGQLVTDLIGTFSTRFIPLEYMNLKSKNVYGVEEVAANLFFEKGSARAVLDMTVSPNLKSAFKKIYNKKMNSSLVNGFDHDKALAFWSMSVNTKEMLQQYPGIMNQTYGSIFPIAKEEIDVAGKLLSIIVDEEAVAKLITGDALFVLNDFAEKDVTYKTYEYDDDYNRKEVTETKKMTVPEFTLMIGSEEKELWYKALKIGEKYKVINKENSVFKCEIRKKDFPLDFYVVVKNDLVYLTTSKTAAINYGASRNNYNTSKYSSLIKNNTSVMYANVNALLNKVPFGYLSKSEKRTFKFSEENLKEAYMKVSRMKGNTISSEIKLNTYQKEENTLKLLFKMINEVAK